MALLRNVSYVVLVLLNLFQPSSSVPVAPVLPSSNAIALAQPSDAVTALLPANPVLPDPPSLRRESVHTRVRNTDMFIQKAGSRRKLPIATTSDLLRDAYEDIKHQSQHYGGDTQLSENYRYTYRVLVLTVFPRIDPPHSATYDTVRDMILGLMEELARLDNVECKVDLRKVVDGRFYNVGFGVLRYMNGFAGKDLNGTLSNPPNGTVTELKNE